MYFLLILFFGSLLGIAFMVGKKLLLLEEGQIFHREEIFKDLYLEKWKNTILKNIKKYSYIGLVATIRFYVHFVNFTKTQYDTIKTKVKKKIAKRSNVEKKVEPSKFLKMMSEYKHKIKKIRHQIIKEEEENL